MNLWRAWRLLTRRHATGGQLRPVEPHPGTVGPLQLSPGQYRGRPERVLSETMHATLTRLLDEPYHVPFHDGPPVDLRAVGARSKATVTITAVDGEEIPHMTIPDEHLPGPPPVLWAASIVDTGAPWSTGIAAWHPYQRVWVALVPGDVIGERGPDDGVALTPTDERTA